MFRNLFRLFAFFIAALVVRQVIHFIGRAFSSAAGETRTAAPSGTTVTQGGELKKDPVCGTFVAAASSIKEKVDGQVVHFCSVACRDKFRVA